ncbi:hypothetical protein [Evansella tamaricis]|uniref:LysM domain-containing protein n=1 Tax=Evansella tamaricis TaxID=2069301 RepID=A0ABS6JEN4_9BACI|nr:hypothetical protein [Evansella tamaricis]MBU9712101.1 hypothetical protein [Evansella tamaricis]
MRPLLVLIIAILVSVSAYYDLRNGTIPQVSSHNEIDIEELEQMEETTDEPSNQVSLPYQEVIVESGHTVYGVVRALHDDSFSIPPYKVVDDFEALNPQVEAHKILVGEIYRFPLYASE